MNILFVAPTSDELNPIKNTLDLIKTKKKNHYFFLESGIGISNSSFSVTKTLLTQSIDFVIQLGVAGSFNANIPIGQVVWVVEDAFCDFGADTSNGFLSMKELNINTPEPTELFNASFNPTIPYPHSLLTVKGITSNTIHNNPIRISAIKKQFNPDIESMEGASIMHVCNQLNIANIQARAISNSVAPREKNQWNFEKAINALSNWVSDYIKKIEE